MAVDSAEWLRLMEAEYLSEFVPEGGSAIKFAVVPDDAKADELRASLMALGESHQMVCAHIDSAETKLHMIQDVFFGVARQIDWNTSAQSFLERLFRKQGYQWPNPGQPMTVQALSAANDVDPTILRREKNQWLTSEIMREPGMAQDFRIAMTRLCEERFVPESPLGASAAPPVLEWLKGDLRAIGPLKSAQIFAKITRTNARPMLRSLCRWLRMLGHGGLMLTIDIRRLAMSLPAGSPGIRYTAAAVMDAFEVLRQLIDNADQFDGLFLVVIAGEPFIGNDQKRSIEAYTALKMRIWDDVRARDRDNPLSPLTTLAWSTAP
ncbi:MAG: DUF2791 family P-loop domain-containing protein [Alphaproteobacteria bacterium]|nr:DUF2791 family P-loop domain-containing protein [Alphaproteobacteria bacterium]